MKPLFASAAVASALLLAGCTTLPASDAPDTPDATHSSSFTVDGTFTFGLGYATKQQFPEGSRCDFEDPLQGRQVTVTNQSGDVVATGKIGAGTTSWAANQGECNYVMKIDGVPGGEKYYRLHVDGYQDTDYLTASDLERYHWLAELS
ncbi:hypothetical protein A0130_02520 [Leifsonia xyli]|uniref:hypothetical protein n=1 Tax=Leifsonia xyli TaxID=1575 RepID=UPI0007CDE52F|nr:hypothetical protein A0130_02520 [Leifsonia xyli]